MSLLLSWAASAYLLDWYGKRRPLPTTPAQAIIVAGCLVRPDGSPTHALARRVEKAVDLWRTGAAPIIVMTGGVRRFPPSEAAAAARYARRLGVPKEALILEENSTTTEENARFSQSLVDGERVIVVTDTYHVFRCERIFSRYFSNVRGVGSFSSPKYRIIGALREVVAVVWLVRFLALLIDHQRPGMVLGS